MTPLGVPVEPEVYCRNAIVSVFMSGNDQCSSSPDSMEVVATQGIFFKSGASSIKLSSLLITSFVVNATDAPALRETDCIRRIDRFRCGGYAGTAIAPA